MPLETGFTVPSLQTIRDRVFADTNAKFSGADAYLPTVLARLRVRATHAFADILAGISYTGHVLAARVAREMLPDLASETNLVRWANLKLETPRLQPAPASVPATFTGTTGGTVPLGAHGTDANGNGYTLDAAVIVPASSTASGVWTADDEGAAGNLAAGATITLDSPVSGVVSEVTVAAPGGAGGRDLETVEELRVRLLGALRRPAEGGNLNHYDVWTRETGDIDQVWARNHKSGAPPNTVEIRFTELVDDVQVAGDDACPDEAKRAAVEAYLTGTEAEDWEDAKAPATAYVDVYALAPDAQTFTIALDDDTPDRRAAIEAELDRVFIYRRSPGGTIEHERLVTACQLGAGDSGVTLTSPAGDITASSINHLLTRGSITWA